jgi:hypothetical protein
MPEKFSLWKIDEDGPRLQSPTELADSLKDGTLDEARGWIVREIAYRQGMARTKQEEIKPLKEALGVLHTELLLLQRAARLIIDKETTPSDTQS